MNTTAISQDRWARYLASTLPEAVSEAGTRRELTASFLRVLNEHQKLLYQIIRTYAHDETEWRDLEQEIILQLWRSYPNYDPAFRLSTWVYRIAFNVTISDFRKRSKRRKKESVSTDDFVFQRSAQEDTALEEKREKLYAAIRLLSPGNRSILLLHLDGHDYVSIAEIVGISTSNVGTRLNRIRQQLRNLLNPK